MELFRKRHFWSNATGCHLWALFVSFNPEIPPSPHYRLYSLFSNTISGRNDGDNWLSLGVYNSRVCSRSFLVLVLYEILLNSSPLEEQPSFLVRLKNFFLTSLEILYKSIVDTWRLEKLAERVLNDTFSFGKLEKSISLLFVNEYPLLNQPKPLTPNVIPVGGLHIRKMEPLPGVRVFLPSTQLPPLTDCSLVDFAGYYRQC